jgi:predicted nicotinamide N-methyase
MGFPSIREIADAVLPSESILFRYAPLAPVPQCVGLCAHQSTDVFSLWQAWEQECGTECGTPFWAIVWPAAFVLAEYITENPTIVANKTVLDIGCGGGVAAIAAALAGARRVIANDTDHVALHVAERNFLANNVIIETSQCNLTESDEPFQADVILVADMFYQRTAAEALLTFLKRAHKSGTQILIADSNRPFAPSSEIDLIAEYTVPVTIELEGVPTREVRLLTLRNS